MDESKIQKILFGFGATFLLTGVGVVCLKESWPASALFVSAASFILLAGVGPYTIKTLSAKLGKAGGEFHFNRYQPTERERDSVVQFAQNESPSEVGKEGKEFIENAEKRAPEKRSPEDYLALATKKWRDKDYDGAFADVYAGLELNPKDVRVQATLVRIKGNIYYDLGLMDQGIKYYKEAIDLDPKGSDPHNNLGLIYTNQGKPKEAEAEYKTAIDLDPKGAGPHTNLGNLYANQGKPKEAEAEHKKAIDLDPKYAVPHNNLGNLYANQGKPKEAEEEYKKAIDLDPKYANPHTNMGLLYANQGKLKEAEVKYWEALRLDPENAVTKRNLERLKEL